MWNSPSPQLQRVLVQDILVGTRLEPWFSVTLTCHILFILDRYKGLLRGELKTVKTQNVAYISLLHITVSTKTVKILTLQLRKGIHVTLY